MHLKLLMMIHNTFYAAVYKKINIYVHAILYVSVICNNYVMYCPVLQKFVTHHFNLKIKNTICLVITNPKNNHSKGFFLSYYLGQKGGGVNRLLYLLLVKFCWFVDLLINSLKYEKSLIGVVFPITPICLITVNTVNKYVFLV